MACNTANAPNSLPTSTSPFLSPSPSLSLFPTAFSACACAMHKARLSIAGTDPEPKLLNIDASTNSVCDPESSSRFADAVRAACDGNDWLCRPWMMGEGTRATRACEAKSMRREMRDRERSKSISRTNCALVSCSLLLVLVVLGF